MTAVATRRTAGAAKPRAGAAAAGFRPEIQALRALAVAGVVLFHLWPNRMTGGYIGVDVFFVISGYLITSHIVRELESNGTISLSRFYARRIRRLLPAAMLVLAVTAVATAFLVPAERARGFLTEVVASAVYVENWVLAANATDYFAAGEPASPVQHYWSLSVEEQFYLIWPLLFLLVAVLGARWARGPLRRRLILTMGVVFAASLVYSVVVTSTSPQFAYFATPAHAWEFAAGGLLALVPATVTSRIAGRPNLSAAVQWTGLVLVVGSMFLFTGATPVPGAIALIPVAGTIAIIVAGASKAVWSPTPLMAWRPTQFVGDVSYSMYLWHWPLIVLVPYFLAHGLTTTDKLLILAATVALAWATRKGIESPVIASPKWRPRRVGYGFAIVSSVVVIGLAVAPIVVFDQRTAQATTQALDEIEGGCFGAEALASGAECAEQFEIDPAYATDTSTYESLSAQVVRAAGMDAACRDDAHESRTCVFNEGGATVVALVGDSHAEHLEPALAYQAVVNDWEVRSYTKRSCPIVEPAWRAEGETEYKQNTPDCIAWREDIIADLAADEDISVVVPTTYAHRVGLDGTPSDQDALAAAFTRTWAQLESAGKQVVVIADTPVARGERMAECLADAASTLDCANPLEAALPPDPLADSVTSESGADVVDLREGFCDDQLCYAVVGGLAVYRDSHHLTPRFSLSLAPLISPALVAAVDGSGR